MSDILQADIFFVIASIATILFSLLVCLALYQVVKILKTIRRLVERIEAGSDMIIEDVEQFRTYVMRGSLISQLVGFFMGTRKGGRKKDR